MSAITRFGHMTVKKLQKNSPKILLVAGFVGFGSTVVLASRATLKAQDVKEKYEKEFVAIDSAALNERDRNTEVAVAWRNRAIEYGKLYAPTVIVGVATIAALTKSHQILASRNTALMAAYAGLDRFIKEYRERVVNEFGPEKDRDLANGVATREIVRYDKDGNAIIQQTVSAAAGNFQDQYNVFFDDFNSVNWCKDPGYNLNFLENQEAWANRQLALKGVLLLNDVYDKLGMERTPLGAQVGWLYKSEKGDGHVDFGFRDYPDFLNLYERSVKLNFNVEGIVWDKF